MSEEHRIISIDPQALKIPENRTKKKRAVEDKSRIQVRAKKQTKPPKPSTMKRNLLNMIRLNQENRLKQKNKGIDVTVKPDEVNRVPPKSDFEESVQFLQNLPPPVVPSYKTPPNLHNTFKNHTTPKLPTPPSQIGDELEPIRMNHFPVTDSNVPPIHIQQPPPYGILKNGSKPTYRNWKNQTQKQ